MSVGLEFGDELFSRISLALTFFAALLYFTGRDIGRHAAWARVLGVLLATGSIFVVTVVLAILLWNLVLPIPLPISLSLGRSAGNTPKGPYSPHRRSRPEIAGGSAGLPGPASVRR